MDAAMLDQLEAEHRDAEGVLERLSEATEADQQRPLVAELVAMMQTHMETEEREVYPELAAIDPELAEEAEVEHRLAREGIARLEEMIGMPGFGAAVDMVTAGIAHHVEDEESEAFPLLRRRLDLEASDTSAGSDDAPTKAELYEEARKAGIEGRSTMNKDELEASLDKS